MEQNDSGHKDSTADNPFVAMATLPTTGSMSDFVDAMVSGVNLTEPKEAPPAAAVEGHSQGGSDPSLPKRRKMKVEEVMEVEKWPSFAVPAQPKSKPAARGSGAFKIYEPGVARPEQQAAVADKEQSSPLPQDKAMADKWVVIAAHFIKVGDLRTALQYTYRALKLFKNHVPALVNLGVLCDQIGKPYDAFIYFMRALAFGGDDRNLISDQILQRVYDLMSRLAQKIPQFHDTIHKRFKDTSGGIKNCIHTLFGEGGARIILQEAIKRSMLKEEDISKLREAANEFYNRDSAGGAAGRKKEDSPAASESEIIVVNDIELRELELNEMELMPTSSWDELDDLNAATLSDTAEYDSPSELHPMFSAEEEELVNAFKGARKLPRETRPANEEGSSSTPSATSSSSSATGSKEGSTSSKESEPMCDSVEGTLSEQPEQVQSEPLPSTEDP